MRRGFTLIELIVVVIIVAILATFALPQYLKAAERARGAKAKHAVSLIAQAEKMCRAETDTYVNASSPTLDTTLGSYVELADVDADADWSYAVVFNANTFTVTATRKISPNGTIILTESGAWSGTWVP